MSNNFWTSPAQFPKRAYRWEVSVKAPNGTGLSKFMAKKVSKPSFTVTESAHAYLNHKFYYPGRLEWNTVTISYVDSQDPDIGLNVMGILKASGYGKPDAKSQKTMRKNALNDLVIAQLDADGKVIEEWVLHSCWIKDVKFGELDYESDDLVEVELEIRFDYATLE